MAGAAMLLCAGVLAAVLQQRSSGGGGIALEERRTPAVLQSLANALRSPKRSTRMREDLLRLARDLDDADKRRDTEGLGMGHHRARDAHTLLARHTTVGALRRLDHATSNLLGGWLGGSRKTQQSSQQLRDELAFGEHAYTRVVDGHERRTRREQPSIRQIRERGEGRDETERARRAGRDADDTRDRRDYDDRRGEHREEGEREHARYERRERGERREGERDDGKRRPRGDLDVAERKEESRVQSFFTSKAEALQRLYRKEQLQLKYEAEYLKADTPPAKAASTKRADAEYRLRQKQQMERAIAKEQQGQERQGGGDRDSTDVDGSSSRDTELRRDREHGVAHRRRVVEFEPAAERDTWNAQTERDIERVDEARAKPEWYGYSSPLRRQHLSSNPIVSLALAPSPKSSAATWPMAPKRHPQGAYKDKTVYDKDYSWPSTAEVVEGDEWQRKGDCGMFGSNC
jgi:hypothetical protein